MKSTFATTAWLLSVMGIATVSVDGADYCDLPDISNIIKLMFLTFEVDENGERVYRSVEWWTLLYYTKRWSGLDHPLTYPSPIFTH